MMSNISFALGTERGGCLSSFAAERIMLLFVYLVSSCTLLILLVLCEILLFTFFIETFGFHKMPPDVLLYDYTFKKLQFFYDESRWLFFCFTTIHPSF
ncbi:hypothetical protein RND71_016142 [Anisodus tanguticus]|uniref:Uncharacterized protein n=1 Tax=Anisodus tanguticus TaxID=243964 RepID=A0AAE1S5L2_9SOLA|nr:hypothetical protein RND71_016142 [Anisodus tanguticus]